MCDQNTMIKIQESVQEFVDRDCMFTAFEVSLAVKEKCQTDGSPSPRHSHIKSDIHDELQAYDSQGIYDQVLHDVGAPQKAFVYVPDGKSVNDYVALNRQDSAKKTDPQPATAGLAIPAMPTSTTQGLRQGISDPDQDGDESDDSGRNVDARGSLCVPTYLLAAAGFNPQDVAYATVGDDDGKPALVLSKSAISSPLTTYTVDYHGGVRVTSSVLAKAGIDDGTYDFMRDGNKLIVTLHEVDSVN